MQLWLPRGGLHTAQNAIRMLCRAPLTEDYSYVTEVLVFISNVGLALQSLTTVPLVREIQPPWTASQIGHVEVLCHR
eukprot:4969189-Amphidinium_carterae.1